MTGVNFIVNQTVISGIVFVLILMSVRTVAKAAYALIDGSFSFQLLPQFLETNVMKRIVGLIVLGFLASLEFSHLPETVDKLIEGGFFAPFAVAWLSLATHYLNEILGEFRGSR